MAAAMVADTTAHAAIRHRVDVDPIACMEPGTTTLPMLFASMT